MKYKIPLIVLILVLIIGAGTILISQGKDVEIQSDEKILDLELVAEGFVSPVDLVSAYDGTDRLFVVDRVGQIRIIENGVLLSEPFLDLGDKIVELRERYDERGFLGLAFHPNFKENGRFFVYYSAPLQASAPEDWDHTSHLSEFKVSSNNINIADPSSEKILLRVDQPQMNHDGGQILFGPDNYLYVGLGDGGGADDVDLGHPEIGNGQDTYTFLGSILRLDVSQEGKYSIPADNPFIVTGGLPEIYAYGFRNPFKFSFDGERLFVADVGQNLFEEVHIVKKGKNYGWNLMEGNHCFNPDSPDEVLTDCDVEGLEPAILEYPHSGGSVFGTAIIGGFVYRGMAIPELYGKYVFADWSESFAVAKGKILVASQNGEKWEIEKLIPLNTFILSLGQDSEGELYVLTSNNLGPFGNTGKVFKLVSKSQHWGCQESEVIEGECVLVKENNVGLFMQDLDSRVDFEEVNTTDLKGFYVEPKGEGEYPGVVMIHEWWGLNENIKYMAKLLASEGYKVFAIDLYGEVAETSERAGELAGEIRNNQEKAIEEMRRAVTYLENQGITSIASMGWCFGGGESLQLSLNHELDATVIYYGQLTNDLDELSFITWPVLGIFGEEDTSITPEIVNSFEDSLNELGIENEIYIYPNVGHAFANPSGSRYAEEETKDAWQKTTDFLEKHLK